MQKKAEDHITFPSDVNSILYAIYCSIRNIEYYTFRLTSGITKTIEGIQVVTVSTEPTAILMPPPTDKVIEIYNVSFSNPQILFVNHNALNVGIPINSGESKLFTIKEGGRIYAWYESEPGDVVIAYVSI